MDKRDRKPYTLAKLPQYTGRTGAPGAVEGWKYAVWMTQNLDLDIDSNVTYTNKDTDLGYNSNTQQYETASWKPSSSTHATNDTAWRGTSTTPESYDVGEKYWNGRVDENDHGLGAYWSEYYRSCSWDSDYEPFNCNESINPTSYFVSSTGIPQYHLGNYYNWTAAVAMNDSFNLEYDKIIEQSICPAGWTLPRVGIAYDSETGHDTFSDDSFYSLWGYYGLRGGWDSYGWNDGEEYSIWTEPLFFAASGGWYGYLGSVGVGGDFWSSLLGDEEYAGAGVFNTRVYTATFNGGGDRAAGSSIRCIARPVSSSLIWDENADY